MVANVGFLDIINYSDIAGILGLIVSVVVVMWNIYNGRIRANSMGMLERGQYLESINKSIEIANTRALAGEQRAIAAEARVEAIQAQAEKREQELEDRICILENNSSYRITFDVDLKSDPKVEHVEIKRFREERCRDKPVDLERRGTPHPGD